MRLREAEFLRIKDGQRFINLQKVTFTNCETFFRIMLKTVNISSSAVHNIRIFGESGEISVRKVQR